MLCLVNNQPYRAWIMRKHYQNSLFSIVRFIIGRRSINLSNNIDGFILARPSGLADDLPEPVDDPGDAADPPDLHGIRVQPAAAAARPGQAHAGGGRDEAEGPAALLVALQPRAGAGPRVGAVVAEEVLADNAGGADLAWGDCHVMLFVRRYSH